jgi:transmembrane sensor
MIPTDDVPWTRLAAYLAGEATADEARRIEAWAAEAPERGAMLAELRRIWVASGGDVPQPDVEAAIARFRARARRRGPFEALPVGSAWPARRPLLAAGLAALAVGGWWASRQVSVSPASPAAPAGREYATTRGQRLSLTLPDGSAVLLGPESVLRIAAGFGEPARTVELQGEGYFTVTHDEARPFEVRTDKAVARDLGTRFVVRARPSEDRVRVIVAEGLVALGTARDSAVLGVADLGETRPDGRIVRRGGVNLSRWLAWTEGRLVFSGTRLDVIVAELERWYDVDIRLADPRLGRRTFTGQFGYESAPEVLEVIRSSLGLELERRGRQYVLRPSLPTP